MILTTPCGRLFNFNLELILLHKFTYVVLLVHDKAPHLGKDQESLAQFPRCVLGRGAINIHKTDANLTKKQVVSNHAAI